MSICQFAVPHWLEAFAASQAPRRFHDDEARIAVAIAASAASIDNGGGPFGAAVFNHVTGELVSVGSNLVVVGNCSHWHAEMVALLLAEQQLDGFDLGRWPLTLATSCEPCVMCLGGVLWSGVNRIVTAAADEDARAIGFDEGPKPSDWAGALRDRGRQVIVGLWRERARSELQRYAAAGGVVYNAT